MGILAIRVTQFDFFFCTYFFQWLKSFICVFTSKRVPIIYFSVCANILLTLKNVLGYILLYSSLKNYPLLSYVITSKNQIWDLSSFFTIHCWRMRVMYDWYLVISSSLYLHYHLYLFFIFCMMYIKITGYNFYCWIIKVVSTAEIKWYICWFIYLCDCAICYLNCYDFNSSSICYI